MALSQVNRSSRQARRHFRVGRLLGGAIANELDSSTSSARLGSSAHCRHNSCRSGGTFLHLQALSHRLQCCSSQLSSCAHQQRFMPPHIHFSGKRRLRLAALFLTGWGRHNSNGATPSTSVPLALRGIGRGAHTDATQEDPVRIDDLLDSCFSTGYRLAKYSLEPWSPKISRSPSPPLAREPLAHHIR